MFCGRDHDVNGWVNTKIDNICLTEYGDYGGSCCFGVFQHVCNTNGVTEKKCIMVGPVSKSGFKSFLKEAKNDVATLKNDPDLERVLLDVEEDYRFEIFLVRKEIGYSLECVRCTGKDYELLKPAITITDIDNFEQMFQQLIDNEEADDDDEFYDKLMLLNEWFDVIKD